MPGDTRARVCMHTLAQTRARANLVLSLVATSRTVPLLLAKYEFFSTDASKIHRRAKVTHASPIHVHRTLTANYAHSAQPAMCVAYQLRCSLHLIFERRHNIMRPQCMA